MEVPDYKSREFDGGIIFVKRNYFTNIFYSKEVKSNY
jgi:hypothetical protein